MDDMLDDSKYTWNCQECRQEHKQLRDWLVELKTLRHTGATRNIKPYCLPVIYDQADKRWGKNMYSSRGDHHQNMERTGGAPTLAADIVATLKDSTANPWTLARLSLEWGCRTYMSGTGWPFFRKVAEHYGFSKFIESSDYDRMTECLDAGGYVVCNMTHGYWCRAMDYILAWKYDDAYVYGVTSRKSHREKQKIENFKKECRHYFCFLQ